MLNFDSINRAIFLHGTTVDVTLYDGTTDAYDTDQNPLNTSTGTTRYCRVSDPSSLDLQSTSGLVSNISKKFTFPNDFTTVENGDDIFHAGGTFRAVEVRKKFTRVEVFGNRISD